MTERALGGPSDCDPARWCRRGLGERYTSTAIRDWQKSRTCGRKIKDVPEKDRFAKMGEIFKKVSELPPELQQKLQEEAMKRAH